MNKLAVVYWSGTGNTEAMAYVVAEGAMKAGAEVSVFKASGFSEKKASEFDAFAFGCPSMGAEQLEESEFEPMFTSIKEQLSGKKIALFGSYGWGDGEWMRDWEESVQSVGAVLVAEGLIVNGKAVEAELEECRALGANLACL